MKKIHLRNITRYEPAILHFGEGIYLRDEKGRDWYEWREYFKPDTMKVLYDPRNQNMIAVMDREHYYLNPEGMSLVEVDMGDVPENYHQDGTWVFENGKIIQSREIKEQVVRDIRNALLDNTDVLLLPHYTLGDKPLTKELMTEICRVRLALKELPTNPEFPDINVELPEFFFKLAVRHGFNPEWLERSASFCPIIIK